MTSGMYDKLFDLATNRGFENDDADVIAWHAASQCDGRDSAQSAFKSFLRTSAKTYLSETGIKLARKISAGWT